MLSTVSGIYCIERSRPTTPNACPDDLALGGAGLKAAAIAGIVRESEDTVVRWLKRDQTEGVEGLKDAPRW